MANDSEDQCSICGRLLAHDSVNLPGMCDKPDSRNCLQARIRHDAKELIDALTERDALKVEVKRLQGIETCRDAALADNARLRKALSDILDVSMDRALFVAQGPRGFLVAERIAKDALSSPAPARVSGHLETFGKVADALGYHTEADARFDKVVAALPKGERRPLSARVPGQSVDAGRGEWRCNCPPDPAFDTSVNPVFVRACAKCGATRPARVPAFATARIAELEREVFAANDGLRGWKNIATEATARADNAAGAQETVGAISDMLADLDADNCGTLIERVRNALKPAPTFEDAIRFVERSAHVYTGRSYLLEEMRAELARRRGGE